MPNSSSESSVPLAQSLLNAVCDLLFCPEFCVAPNKSGGGRDEAEDLQNLDSCEYIWAPGVGFANAPQNAPSYDLHRRELLRLLATCFSQSMYLPPVGEAHAVNNRWVAHFTSAENRHALPLFTSLLNLVCSYDPAGILPYNHLLFQVRKLCFFFCFLMGDGAARLCTAQRNGDSYRAITQSKQNSKNFLILNL